MHTHWPIFTLLALCFMVGRSPVMAPWKVSLPCLPLWAGIFFHLVIVNPNDFLPPKLRCTTACQVWPMMTTTWGQDGPCAYGNVGWRLCLRNKGLGCPTMSYHIQPIYHASIFAQDGTPTVAEIFFLCWAMHSKMGALPFDSEAGHSRGLDHPKWQRANSITTSFAWNHQQELWFVEGFHGSHGRARRHCNTPSSANTEISDCLLWVDGAGCFLGPSKNCLPSSC